MRIHLPPQARQAEGKSLQAPGQHSDRDHQQQPIDPLRVPRAAVSQLEHTGFLITEQLFAAEAPALAADQIQARFCVADQVPRFFHWQAGGMGQHQIRCAAAISPESDVPEPAAALG